MNRLIHYEQSSQLEEEDQKMNVPLYSIEMYGEKYLICVGHERKLMVKSNIYYFPVYLVDNSRSPPDVYKQIGVYEFESEIKEESKRLQKYMDSEGDIDITKLGDLLLYSFADANFFKVSKLHVSQGDVIILEEDYQKRNPPVASEIPITQGDEDDGRSKKDDPFYLEIPKHKMSTTSLETSALLKNGVFEKESTIQPPHSLVEESREDAEYAKEEFKSGKNNKWIENFMKNNHYDIVPTSTNGDCFFDAIKQAYLQQGMKTTVEKLRAIVASEATEETLQSYKRLFSEMNISRDEIMHEMDQLKREVVGLKNRMKIVADTRAKQGTQSYAYEEQQEIQKRMASIAERNQELKEMYITNNEYYQDYVFIKNIDSVEDLQKFMKTSAYWADEWSLGVLERKLKVKCIVFAEYNYKEGDFNWILMSKNPKKDRIFQCTTSEMTNPKHYILLSYTGKHYELISYKNKYLFSFSEMPYDVKIMVVIKCMEGPSIYRKIQDFVHFQQKLGISSSADEEREEDQDDEEEIPLDLLEHAMYDPEVVFVYYAKSANTVAPGKGNGESVTPEKAPEYKELGLKKHNGWRRMLDDAWPSEFTLDGHQWYSVEHYYQASKFAKMHPDFYKTFTLDQGSETISKDVEMAVVAGSKTGAKGKTQIRPQNIKIDSDFYGGRHVEEREKALFSKFTQNEVLNKILRLTKHAKLVKYVPKQKSEADVLLMKVRKTIHEKEKKN